EETQNSNLKANCITRGSPESVVILPTAPLVKLFWGCPKITALATLKTSQRNCRCVRSVIPKLRTKEVSKTFVCGPTKVFRPESPMAPGAVTAKALLSPGASWVQVLLPEA